MKLMAERSSRPGQRGFWRVGREHRGVAAIAHKLGREFIHDQANALVRSQSRAARDVCGGHEAASLSCTSTATNWRFAIPSSLRRCSPGLWMTFSRRARRCSSRRCSGCRPVPAPCGRRQDCAPGTCPRHHESRRIRPARTAKLQTSRVRQGEASTEPHEGWLAPPQPWQVPEEQVLVGEKQAIPVVQHGWPGPPQFWQVPAEQAPHATQAGVVGQHG